MTGLADPVGMIPLDLGFGGKQRVPAVFAPRLFLIMGLQVYQAQRGGAL